MAWSSVYPIIWQPQALGGDSTSVAVSKHVLEIVRLYQIISEELAPLSHSHLEEDILDFAHTHPIAEITNFSTHTHTAAQVTGTVPVGLISMWSGSVESIPTGWALCDGADGRPDLRDKFIIGAGSTYAVGSTGGSATVTLSANKIPSHAHLIAAAATGTSVATYGVTSTTHITAGSDATVVDTSYAFPSTETEPTLGLTSTVGGGEAHENLPPYYALAYIIKLAY